MKVGVLGARGKVGAEVCRAMEAADDLEPVASVDTGEGDDSLDDLVAAGADAIVDFTHPDVVTEPFPADRINRNGQTFTTSQLAGNRRSCPAA